MTESQPNSFFDMDMGHQAGSSIDFKRVFYRARRFWYLIVASVVIALGIAHFKNRYATRIYPITASFLIKETQETAEGKILYNNPLVSHYRNYLNELYLIRSYPLVQSVIEDLNFGVSFYREGNFMTSEAYDYIPVNAYVLQDSGTTSKKLILRLIDENHFQLKLNGESDIKQERTFSYGDTIHYANLTLLFQKRDGRDVLSYRNQYFIFLYTRPSSLTGSYIGRLRIEWAQEGAGIVNLSINGTNPLKEIDFLNGLIKSYQEYDLEKKNQSATRTIEFIGSQLSDIRDSLNIVESELERFRNSNASVNLESEAERLYNKLEALDIQRAELALRENYYEYLIEYIKKSENLDQVIMPSSIGIGDEILANLVGKMIDLQLEMKLYIGQEKGDNPILSEKRRRLNEIKKSIVELVQNQLATEKIKLKYFDQQIKEAEGQLRNIPLAQRHLVSIQRNYTLLENLYVFLMQKKAEADISKASATSDISIINPPMQAGGAIYPKEGQNYSIALLVSLILPFAAFFIIEFFNVKVQSKEDIEKVTQIPFIGGIGHNKTGDNKVVLANPKSSVAESFRSLRSNLNYFTGNKPKSLFLISSSISGEGKTFTTINLATVLALSGKRILIVGADLRRPKLFEDFDLRNDKGLSNYLAGLNSFDEIVQHTSEKDLDLISGGTVPPNPSELLLNPKMDEFIEKCKSQYDYVIVDTPPLAIVTDAYVLAKYADHIVFVVRQNYTPRELLKTVQEYYGSGRLHNISILLNDIFKSGPGYGYGYSYGYGYGYGVGKKDDYGYYEEPLNNK